jgi:hypothetical protein
MNGLVQHLEPRACIGNGSVVFPPRLKVRCVKNKDIFIYIIHFSPAQKRRNAMELRAMSRLSECGLLVNEMRQLTQSVKVLVSVSVMWTKCSRTILSMVSNARRAISGSLSPAAVLKTMKTDFQPDLTLVTRASTIW